jgi:CBS domain containing-hemolysin-like protein
LIVSGALNMAGSLALFLLGLRLSAFFSGSETGFYRASHLRLGIDAHGGDRVAARIMWFVRNPGYFVATTLVGNNVANYLTTLAIGLAAVTLFPENAGWLEIVATLALAPLVFIFGELVPKYLYYRAPTSLLRQGAMWFLFFYRLFLVVSFPLIWITKLFERFGNLEKERRELVLGRSRLVQVLSQGHREGLLSEVQSRLVHGLMHTAAQPVSGSMTPTSRILGLPEDASREEMLDFARRYGVPNVAVKRAGTDSDWYGYLRVVDLAVSRRPHTALIRALPRIESSASKLEALLTLREADKAYGAVFSETQIVGIVSERGLVEQLF